MQSKKITLEDRVYVERVKLFFGSAVGNVGSAIIGAIFMLAILRSANVPLSELFIWLGFIIIFSVITVYIEKRFTKETFTIDNAAKRFYIRSFPSSLISLSYGLTPLLFGSYLGVQEDIFLFITLLAMISIAVVGYTTMPYYYFLLNIFTMMPITIYFFLHDTLIHTLLGLISIIWQILIISKGWKISKLSIGSIRINEQLHDEIEHHKKTKDKLNQLATHDALTGLPNRRLLMEKLDSMISLARRHKKEVTVMFIDLDGFKKVNDVHGHKSGDEVLVEISKRLKLLIRESDTIARLGGDEFTASFIDIDDKDLDIDILANRIINSLSKPIILQNDHTVKVGISIGIAQFPNDGGSLEELLRISDAGMYTSKALGGNTFTYADKASK